MEIQFGERKLILWIVLGIVTLGLMCGSCGVGALLAPRLGDLLPFGKGQGAGSAQVATRDATPTPIPPVLLDDADAEERLVAAIYERVAPSVVHIRVVQHVSGGERPQLEMPRIPGWPEMPEVPREFYRRGEGSGFVWDTQGHIVTNYHVVQNAKKVEVIFFDGTTLLAEAVGSDPDADLAVLKVNLPADQLRAVTPGDSDAVFVGQRAIAIGNPFGQEWTLTTGIVSALGRTMPSGTSRYSIPKMIQTDAAINPGNSGGPLLDREGRVIGVNTMIVSNIQASVGVGFATPVNVVKRVVPMLIEEGRYAYAWLGITGRDLDRETAITMELPPEQRGALVIEVAEEGPADEAGLQGSSKVVNINGAQVLIGGDVITAVDERPIQDMNDLIVYLIEETRPGDGIMLTLLHDGQERQVKVTLTERPREP
jgi:2-alkenal reductase